MKINYNFILSLVSKRNKKKKKTRGYSKRLTRRETDNAMKKNEIRPTKKLYNNKQL